MRRLSDLVKETLEPRLCDLEFICGSLPQTGGRVMDAVCKLIADAARLDGDMATMIGSLKSGEHAKALAMLAWFASRGAPSGSFVGDPDDSRKQTEARDAFEAWWAGR